jgi:hypothetical protein
VKSNIQESASVRVRVMSGYGMPASGANRTTTPRTARITGVEVIKSPFMENQNAGGGHHLRIQIRRWIDQGPRPSGVSRATRQRSIQRLLQNYQGDQAGKWICGSWLHQLIIQVCDEILAGQHRDKFPLHVWMTGSGTQFNMNVNEVISNGCCQLAGTSPDFEVLPGTAAKAPTPAPKLFEVHDLVDYD